jgi:response regulator RpfG family c-di-GMP phosphodiesterase
MTEKTILCVDDEQYILRSLKRLLRKEPYRLLVANSGTEALEILEQETVHLVCSDYRMPSMTGTELLSQVARLFPRTVRIVLSGYADVAAIVEAINDGHIYRFLSKPWDDDQLKANLKSCLNHQTLLESHYELTQELAQRNAELRRLSELQQSLIDERTRSLQMAQEIVQSIPIPLVGVSADGIVALSNALSDQLLQTPVGADVREIFPADLANLIMNALHTGNRGCEESKATIGDIPYVAKIAPLYSDDTARGSVVLLEAEPCVL